MFIDEEELNKRQVDAWNRLLWQNFGQRVREDRAELEVYIENHWGEGLLEPPNWFERLKKIGMVTSARWFGRFKRKAAPPIK